LHAKQDQIPPRPIRDGRRHRVALLGDLAMAEIRGTPPVAPNQVETIHVGPTPSVAPAPTPAPGTPGAAGQTYPPTKAPHPAGDPTDPINGIGIEGEEPVWEARYSMRNFIGRLVTRTALVIAWICLAVYTWGYGHETFAVPTWIALAVVVGLWIALIFRIIEARFGHYYRLTTRRLFVSTGIFRRDRDQMELLKVKDVYTHQHDMMDRVLGLGTVVVTSSEKNLPPFHLLGIDDPKRVMDLIWHQARAEQDQRNVRVEQT